MSLIDVFIAFLFPGFRILSAVVCWSRYEVFSRSIGRRRFRRCEYLLKVASQNIGCFPTFCAGFTESMNFWLMLYQWSSKNACFGLAVPTLVLANINICRLIPQGKAFLWSQFVFGRCGLCVFYNDNAQSYQQRSNHYNSFSFHRPTTIFLSRRGKGSGLSYASFLDHFWAIAHNCLTSLHHLCKTIGSVSVEPAVVTGVLREADCYDHHHQGWVNVSG